MRGPPLLATTMATTPNHKYDDGEYELHWIDKGSASNIPQFAKRKAEATCQQTGWSLCPASVGGGCCPDYFACDTKSCYATTAGPTSCNGQLNYYNCPLTAGPGSCCPVGLICGDGSECIPPPGVSSSVTCPASFFNCPASFGGGCCGEGKVCGSNVCYDATPMTRPVSELITTTDSSGRTTVTAVTSTMVITDGPGLSGTASASGVPQLIPSTVAKVDAVQTGGSDGGNGLSKGALGGIIAGAVVVLLIILAVAAFIIIRLRKTERVAKAAEAADYRRESSNNQSKSGFGQPSISEIDSTTDVNALGLFPLTRPSPHLTGSSTANETSPSRTTHFRGSGASSPPIWAAPLNYAPSEASDGRQSSLSSYPYYEGHPPHRVSMASYASHGSLGHSRRTSETSELDGQHGVSELGAIDHGEAGSSRQSSGSQRAAARPHARKNSDLPGLNRGRSDAEQLGTVSEVNELHGYYGPPHDVAGQTAANLNRPSSIVDIVDIVDSESRHGET
ncbi:hypothetical protein GGR50DRAFT_676866 [Xylaria sp. CBS 124048]|nr:hypothetical protein GGR50DRAFT_676866 [Xylaria sp. CBS 124048]